ncbi:MAG: glycosyltransferase family 4 protein [Steroidobacteraceae bacterium]
MLPRVCFVGLANLAHLAPQVAPAGAGGAELQQVLLARALVQRGFEVSTVVYDHGQPDGACYDGIRAFRTFPPDAGIRMVRFFHPRWSGIWGALRRADADIYYVSIAGMPVGETVLFAHLRGRKAIYRVAHDADCDARTLLIRYGRDRALYRWGLARADLVLAQTSAQQRLLRERFGRSSRVIPSLAESGGRRPVFAERDIDVLWVANLRDWKRPELLLELARRLPQLAFHMAGGPCTGAAPLYESVRARAAALPNVRFHGHVPYAAIGELFARARVLTNTSDAEGFPNTYLQAWAHGTPVVAFLDPDSIIEQRGLGRPVRSIEQMTGAVAELTSRETIWSATSERCVRYAERRCDSETLIAPFVEALLELHSGSEAPSRTGDRPAETSSAHP